MNEIHLSFNFRKTWEIVFILIVQHRRPKHNKTRDLTTYTTVIYVHLQQTPPFYCQSLFNNLLCHHPVHLFRHQSHRHIINQIRLTSLFGRHPPLVFQVHRHLQLQQSFLDQLMTVVVFNMLQYLITMHEQRMI